MIRAGVTQRKSACFPSKEPWVRIPSPAPQLNAVAFPPIFIIIKSSIFQATPFCVTVELGCCSLYQMADCCLPIWLAGMYQERYGTNLNNVRCFPQILDTSPRIEYTVFNVITIRG